MICRFQFESERSRLIFWTSILSISHSVIVPAITIMQSLRTRKSVFQIQAQGPSSPIGLIPFSHHYMNKMIRFRFVPYDRKVHYYSLTCSEYESMREIVKASSCCSNEVEHTSICTLFFTANANAISRCNTNGYTPFLELVSSSRSGIVRSDYA